MTPPRRLLLIDDERLQHRLVGQMLRQFRGAHFELETASNCREGLEQLRTGRHAAALLDYRLTDGDGLSLLAEARASGCRTPVIFLTANTGDDLDMAALEAGAVDYLEKAALSPKVLERSLRYALRLSETLEQLRQLATRDQLTGLLNRREFDRILGDELNRGRRFGRPVALALIDIDHFKKVNDTHGHPAGDAVLQHVAGIVAAQARNVDFVARYGGEEMAVIMIESTAGAARVAMERTAAYLALTPCRIGELVLPVTFSAGVACVPDDGDSAPGLIAAADQALYAAKRAGRNRVVSAQEAQLAQAVAV